MRDYTRCELYKALIQMTVARQNAADALRCVTSGAETGQSLLQKASQCETLLSDDLPAEEQVHYVIALADEFRQAAAANARCIFIEQEGCVSGGYDQVFNSTYSDACDMAAMSLETFAQSLKHVHCHLIATRMLKTLDA